MDPWSNIETSTQDEEISQIDHLEKTLGDIPPAVRKIRELVTRFEVCHFKYKQHLKYIHDSILNLNPITNPDIIGSNHISKGENAWINDKTGRSFQCHQYLLALGNWLSHGNKKNLTDDHDLSLDKRISKWLGDHTTDKERIVRLLIARLTYDWESYQKLQIGGQFKELEYQTCRMDICHYAFPYHFNTLIKAIGNMQPQKDLEGCGSFTPEIKQFITEKYSGLVSSISDILKDKAIPDINKNDQFRIWLYLCLAKTIKEQTGILL